MAEKKDEMTASKKLSGFLDKNKKVFWILLIVVVCAVIGFVCGQAFGSSAKVKDLGKIDLISYELTNDSASLSSEELNTKRDATIESLNAFTSKVGVVGVRANLLTAELYFQKEDYESAVKYYEAAAKKGKTSYTSPIANYNLGVCYENLNNLEAAAEAYKKASDDENYILRTHAKFSYGRVLETLGKYKEAFAAYNEVNDISPDDDWAKLAKTRALKLQLEGKTE
ncbi:MAG: tetratricopeptide repeat protein [Treponema sp.]|nr:tetratricopeptide repeat protein [Treponema sp.]